MVASGATVIWDKVFKNGPSKICGRWLVKNLKKYGLLEADHTPSNFLKTVFHKSYLVHSKILCPCIHCQHLKLLKEVKYFQHFRLTVHL